MWDQAQNHWKNTLKEPVNTLRPRGSFFFLLDSSHFFCPNFKRPIHSQKWIQGNTPPQYSGKIDQNWAFDLVFTVFCVYHHSRPRTAKVRKTCFSSRAAWVSSLSGYVGRRTGICIPTNGYKRRLMTLSFLFFKACGTIFFSHIQDLSRTCVPANLVLPLTLHVFVHSDFLWRVQVQEERAVA